MSVFGQIKYLTNSALMEKCYGPYKQSHSLTSIVIKEKRNNNSTALSYYIICIATKLC